ncbi:MAG: DNA polymerase III subunit [Planctomycetota bacterium]
MSFDRVRGQPLAVSALRAALSSGRLAHAYLLSGAAGVGKRTLARELVKAALCEQKEDDACDRCGSCRAVESGNSWECGGLGVEVSKGELRPLEDSDREIKVGSIRAMERELSVKVAAGRTRAVVVPRAERMNEEAQNALLKTLEEPSGSRLLVLTSRRPDGLLPTVVSRLARVRLRRLSADEVAAYLREERGMAPGEAAELAAASGGSIGAALEADLEEVRAGREFAAARLGADCRGKPLELSEAVMAFARERAGGGKGLEPVRRGLLALFGSAAELHRGALWRSVGAEDPAAAAVPAAAGLAELGTAALKKRLEALIRAERAVAGYASPELVCRVLAGEFCKS